MVRSRKCTTSAYMLVYIRLSDLKAISKPIPKSDIPQELSEALLREKEEALELERLERIKSMYTEVGLVTGAASYFNFLYRSEFSQMLTLMPLRSIPQAMIS